jgi:hypothetical protein
MKKTTTAPNIKEIECNQAFLYLLQSERGKSVFFAESSDTLQERM